MRRLVALILCALMLCGSAFAYDTDYWSVSDDNNRAFHFAFNSGSGTRYTVLDYGYLVDILASSDAFISGVVSYVNSNANTNLYPSNPGTSSDLVLRPIEIRHYLLDGSYTPYFALYTPYLSPKYMSGVQATQEAYFSSFLPMHLQEFYDSSNTLYGPVFSDITLLSTDRTFSGSLFTVDRPRDSAYASAARLLALFRFPDSDTTLEHISVQLASLVSSISAIKNSTLSFNEEMLDKVTGLRESVTGINNMILQMMGDLGDSTQSLYMLTQQCEDLVGVVKRMETSLDALVKSTSNIEDNQAAILDYLMDSIDSDIINIYYGMNDGFDSVISRLNDLADKLDSVCEVLPDILAELQKTNFMIGSLYELLDWMKENWPDRGDINNFNDFFVDDSDGSQFSFWDIFKSIFAAIRSVFASLFLWFVKPILEFALSVPRYIASAFSIFDDVKGGGDLW